VIDIDCVTLDLNNVFSSTRAIKNQGKRRNAIYDPIFSVFLSEDAFTCILRTIS